MTATPPRESLIEELTKLRERFRPDSSEDYDLREAADALARDGVVIARLRALVRLLSTATLNESMRIAIQKEMKSWPPT